MPADESRELPPLLGRVAPVVSVESLLAIDVVTLAAGEIPPGVLKQFYVGVLGLKLVESEAGRMKFSYLRREVILDRAFGGPGRLALVIAGFGEVMQRLHEHRIGFEVLHTDSGLTRVAMLRDPAGNWVHLLETRAF